jgi:hypothetical protein
MAGVKHYFTYFLYPLALPVFLLFLYYSKSRNPALGIVWSLKFLGKAFLVVQAIWIGFGLITITLDHNTHFGGTGNGDRCFPDTQVCSYPGHFSYGPLAWVLVHAPMVPLGLSVEATEQVGMERTSADVETTAERFVAIYTLDDYPARLFAKMGIYLFLALLFMPMTLLVWLYHITLGG